jgi:hypothetical protein
LLDAAETASCSLLFELGHCVLALVKSCLLDAAETASCSLLFELKHVRIVTFLCSRSDEELFARRCRNSLLLTSLRAQTRSDRDFCVFTPSRSFARCCRNSLVLPSPLVLLHNSRGDLCKLAVPPSHQSTPAETVASLCPVTTSCPQKSNDFRALCPGSSVPTHHCRNSCVCAQFHQGLLHASRATHTRFRGSSCRELSPKRLHTSLSSREHAQAWRHPAPLPVYPRKYTILRLHISRPHTAQNNQPTTFTHQHPTTVRPSGFRRNDYHRDCPNELFALVQGATS